MPPKTPSRPLSLAPDALGHEARASDDDHQSLRLWLRLLSCTNQLEGELRRRLHAQFGMSLSRFDYLAQLHRHADGLSMSALSSYLMVTGGSVTGLTNELVKEGLVTREVDEADRRSFTLRLTPAGRKSFERIAAAHESWVVSLFAGLGVGDRERLSDLLGRLRLAVASGAGEMAAAPAPAATGRPRRR